MQLKAQTSYASQFFVVLFSYLVASWLSLNIHFERSEWAAILQRRRKVSSGQGFYKDERILRENNTILLPFWYTAIKKPCQIQVKIIEQQWQRVRCRSNKCFWHLLTFTHPHVVTKPAWLTFFCLTQRVNFWRKLQSFEIFSVNHLIQFIIPGWIFIYLLFCDGNKVIQF